MIRAPSTSGCRNRSRFLRSIRRRCRSSKAGLPEAAISKPSVTFVSVDFDKETLSEQLVKAGFVVGKKTVVTLEGVTQYITREGAEATLKEVGALVRTGFVDLHLVRGLAAGNRPRSHLQQGLCQARDRADHSAPRREGLRASHGSRTMP